ncbi:MAG: alkaline phosphatase [Luteibaculaceae bacterium]
MNRRNFFKNTALASLGIGLFPALTACSSNEKPRKKAKNIIFLVSDGMSMGTLTMADMLLQRKNGIVSNWLNAYQTLELKRALMETSSASSLITDSAAASSAWGGGVRVPNGKLNIGANGEIYEPILQKFKSAGKKVGCVTTVPITHATPAGFCVNEDKRGSQDAIAEKYLSLRFDVMMGGGRQYFAGNSRKDGVDLLQEFRNASYQVVTSKMELDNLTSSNPILGVFSEDALPYSIDHENSNSLKETVPTLSQLTKKAIEVMQDAEEGFVLQVEAGKVDWAAHGNDITALLFDQIEFDNAVKVALEFAQQNEDTLVIITTDHGNANPGLFYGKEADTNFERIHSFKQSNAWVFEQINKDSSIGDIRSITEQAQGFAISTDEAAQIQNHFNALTEKEIYNPRNLPFSTLATIQKKYINVGWACGDHTADFVELAMFGPGSEALKPFVKNYELHNFMLEVAQMKEEFLVK